MELELVWIDRKMEPIDKTAPDYQAQCVRWCDRLREAEERYNGALALVLSEAIERVLGLYDERADERADVLDEAIDLVLHALPVGARVAFDALRPNCNPDEA